MLVYFLAVQCYYTGPEMHVGHIFGHGLIFRQWDRIRLNYPNNQKHSNHGLIIIKHKQHHDKLRTKLDEYHNWATFLKLLSKEIIRSGRQFTSDPLDYTWNLQVFLSRAHMLINSSRNPKRKLDIRNCKFSEFGVPIDLEFHLLKLLFLVKLFNEKYIGQV